MFDWILTALYLVNAAAFVWFVRSRGYRPLPAVIAALLFGPLVWPGWFLIRWTQRRGEKVRRLRPRWQWVPAPGWPSPPSQWSPPPGWRPDPTWPAPTPGHKFWQRTAHGRRLRIAGISLLILLPTVLIAGPIVYGPCVFDPVPGNVSGLPVINDTESEIVVGECDDAQCEHAATSVMVRPGVVASYRIAACNGGTLAVARADDHSLLGCLAEPTGQADSTLPAVRASTRLPCAPPIRPGSTVTFADTG